MCTGIEFATVFEADAAEFAALFVVGDCAQIVDAGSFVTTLSGVAGHRSAGIFFTTTIDKMLAFVAALCDQETTPISRRAEFSLTTLAATTWIDDTSAFFADLTVGTTFFETGAFLTFAL